MTRSPAAVILAGSLVLSGCSLFSGGSDGADPSTKPRPAPTTLSSTAWKSAPASDVAQGGTLRLGTSALPKNFNPLHADAADSEVDEILSPTVGSAVRVTANGGWTVDPDYAESVEVTDKDPLTVEVHLNPRAVWQGGSSITARDMVAFWKAQDGSDGDFEIRSMSGYDNIASVDPGKNKFDYSVTFKEPTADWPMYIYPRLAANVSSSPDLFNKAFRKRAISSNGPYVVDSIDTRSGTVTEKPNPRWWGDKPKLATITWQAASSALQAKALVAGELDAIDLDPENYPQAKKAGTVQRVAGIEWTQLTLNGGRGPLRDPKVRRAVALAIDRDTIAKQSARAVGAPAATLGSLILVPGQKGYADSAAPIDHDVIKAKALLTKAGWTADANGKLARKGERLSLTMPVPAKTPSNALRARLIARDLRDVGITVRLRIVPADKFFSGSVVPLDFDIVTFVRRGAAFPISAAEALFYPVDSAENFTGLGAERIGEGWDVTNGTLDDPLRYRRVAKLDEWLFKEMPMVPLAVNPIVVAVRSNVVNYGAAQFEQPDWTIVGFAKKKG